MSDMVTGALLTVFGGLIGSLATIGIAHASRKDVLRLAAVEKRLAAHQEAYELWCRLLRHLLDQKLGHETAVECQAWWQKNCLYLDARSRAAFWAGTVDAAMYHELKTVNDPRETFKRLESVLRCLAEGVGLPAIGEHEFAETLRKDGGRG